MSKIEDKSIELLDKLDALATQYTPEVLDGAINAVRVTAIGELIWGVFGLGAAFLLWWLTKNFMLYCRKKKKEDGYMSDWEIGWSVSFGAGTFGCATIFMVSISNLFNIWNWVAIYNPQLALAHRVLGL